MTTAGPKIARIRRRPAILWVDVGTVTFTIVPVTSLKFCCHIKWLVNAFTVHKQPFHEGKYATPLAIAGVADISFLAKNFGLNPKSRAVNGLIDISSQGLLALLNSPPRFGRYIIYFDS
ncbi:hypothetical protein ACJRO7_028573 [Eucalyptus globulus]|uniref:Uncharacterized protein n=1 Tax=Eucalyptus globulus TaxID=34317 RepID=A0ABD3JYN1_EUCGL